MKPQKRSRSSKDDVGLDRLSEMPDQVIVHILSCMPTRDAVKTMLLRRFGNLWTMLPALSFDFDDYYITGEDENVTFEEEERIMSEAFSRFARFVRNVLMLHRRSTIDSFDLDIGESKSGLVDPCLLDDVQVWLKFATDREVKDLVFHCDYDDKIVPPQCVFTCQSLVTLTLWGSMLVQYVHQPQLHMGALRKLSLISVTGSNEAFNQLISACPSIQKLKLHNSGLQDLNITAPSANRLDLDIYVTDRPFTLNCPHVEILKIALERRHETSQSNLLDVIDVSSLQDVFVKELPNGLSGPVIKTFLRHFRDVEVFTLSGDAFEQLCCLEKVDILQNTWQSLGLQPRWDNERCLQGIIGLMKSSVDLEELIVYGGASWRSEGNHGVISSELPTSCEMPLLKYVTIHGYGKYREGQLQLVEFVLRNAVILEKLVITCDENRLTAVEELEFLKQVLRFKKASENVIVEFA